MGSNFHYTIDLNEDQHHQPFLSSLGSSLHQNHQPQHFHHQASSNLSSSMPPSLSYFPFLIDSHQDQVYFGYNTNTFHGVLDTHLSQPLEPNKFVSDVSSSSSDQMVPEKETRLKLTIKKKDNHQDRTNLPEYPTKGKTGTNTLKWVSSKVRLMKKKKAIITTTDSNKQHVNNDQSSDQSNLDGDHDRHNNISTNQYNIIVDQNGYNGSSNDCVIRICSDCNTTKTPLWRSGPRGPKSLCNACGIRQRKARRAAATATGISHESPPVLKKKMKNKNKRSNGVCNLSSPSDKKMITVEEAATAGDLETQNNSSMLSSSSSSDKFYFDDLAILLSKSSAYQQVFPQDEKEAAILLMALSYGMVHG
ncbi:PREDICTED: putative GATA transcription factor 22 [Camelina sativa]|uniref:GATA transcription factor 22 n=1 Tax=Camelina sativa TaxID=90675 RepID=A0ABM0UBN7_CAMSA|nr:PREDICTED: putative GATA transcription factor 22 [Camelina sativa]